MTKTANHIKQRIIQFREPVADNLKADNAILLLAEVNGVTKTRKLDELRLSVSYDLHKICLEQLECALGEIGFHLDNSLIIKLKRALYYYVEENEREHLGISKAQKAQGCAVKVFAARYKKINRGCRDSRPEHFRRYL